MDCCNYLSHRQPYYGSHYYESNPPYHADYQQHHFGMHQYSAPPNWAFAASCSDYVYNPKEARIRKAMRERERSMGAAQMGNARSRRPNWPKPPVHMPGPGPSGHQEHLLGNSSKDLCSALRHEMEHGFLSNNGGYVYPSQQYSQFSPQSDYAAYIQVAPGLSNWMQNQYMSQGNSISQQQMWNQYQNERLRVQSAGPSYMINPQNTSTPEYQNVEHISSNNMMQMGPTIKPTIHQNIENAANEVERYMNIPNIITSSSKNISNNVEVRSSMNESLQSVENTSVSPRSVRNCTPISTAPEVTETAAANASEEIVSTVQESNSTELNISSVTAMSEVDAQINSMETNGNSADTGFGGMGLFDESSIPNIASGISTTKKPKLVKPNSIPSPPELNGSKLEMNDSLQPLFPIDFVPGRPPFLPQNNYLMDHFMPDLPNPYHESSNIILNKPEFPVDFSAQKYYESVANGNFDGPLIPGEHFGNYRCEDGFNYLSYPNPQEISNTCSFSSGQFEVNQFLNDPDETRLVSNENNCILDLSKMHQSKEQFQVSEEKNASEKLTEVSHKICEELSKIM